MALRGIKVLEMAGLAPAPFCGMILADFGANVIRVDRTGNRNTPDSLSRGKRSITINMKSKSGIDLFRKICKQVDVLIEPYRKGVMEKFGVGPDILLKDNPRLVYARLTGFGQKGPLSEKAGHDINFIAISGILSKLGRQGEKPYAPINLLADFAGGGLLCAFGITMALYERTFSGQGQVVDSNMVEGSAYIGSFLWTTKHVPVIGDERGTGWLDGGAPWYDTYETKDGLFMSVGALEPQFYEELLNGLGLDPSENMQFGNWPALRRKFTEVFKTKTQKEWTEIFRLHDACVMPVVPLEDAAHHEHNKVSQSFISNPDGTSIPKPAPGLSRSPATCSQSRDLMSGQHTREVLREFGFSEDEIRHLVATGTVDQLPEQARL